ncbi:hypothetical protein LCGC14_0466500 [marine sediment metagenome]|uniref:Uncharacterized protein n=1 Tax=marine sediment metagenome TaxID=412755 RepID=A0A0F9SDN4_9ZZZZ
MANTRTRQPGPADIRKIHTGDGGGDNTFTSVYGSRPAASNDGDLFLPSDGFVIERDTGAAWIPWGPLFPFVAPVNGDFAWINQGTGSVDVDGGGIYLLAPTLAGDNLRIRKKTIPSVPYVITVAFMPHGYKVNYSGVGIGFRQSSDGKLHTFHLSISVNSIASIKFTNPTTWSATYLEQEIVQAGSSPVMWLRIEDNNTNRKCHWSVDGRHWFEFHSVGRTDFLTADEIFFFTNSNNATYPTAMTLLSWAET